STLLTTLPLALLLIIPFFKKRWRGEGYLVIPATIIFGFMIIFGGKAIVYRSILYSARPLIPLVTIVGCIFLASHFSGAELNRLKKQRIFLILTMPAAMSLVQFPFSHYIYFYYVSPLAIIAILFVIAGQKNIPRKLWISFGILYLLFALIWLNRASVSPGKEFVSVENNLPLRLERGGLKVGPPAPQIYYLLVTMIKQHSLPGDYIYASLDCPEVYFLSGRKNPTRTLFDLFDADFKGDPQGRIKRILALIEERKISVVVVRWHGKFSGWFNRDLLEEIEARFPNRLDIHIFTIFWREEGASES
ncbi:MAG: hypothetical protein U9N73_10080, partial [Candidatus Auribacterota bacterium]|nr:hypothetical protein [Candidatus Auribacterota bacterium]